MDNYGILDCFGGMATFTREGTVSKLKLLILGVGSQGINCLEIARSTKRYEDIASLDDEYEGDSIITVL